MVKRIVDAASAARARRFVSGLDPEKSELQVFDVSKRNALRLIATKEADGIFLAQWNRSDGA